MRTRHATILLTAIALAFIWVNLAEAQGTPGIFDKTATHFETMAKGWEAGIRSIAERVFWGLAGVSCAWMVGQTMMQGASMERLLGELVKFAAVTGVMHLLLENCVEIANAIMGLTLSMGGSATGTATQPEISMFYEMATEVIFGADNPDYSIIDEFTVTFIAMAECLVLLLMAVVMVKVLATYYVVTYAGIIVLGLTSTPQGRGLMLNYIRALISLAVNYVVTFMMAAGIYKLLDEARHVEGGMTMSDHVTLFGMAIASYFLLRDIPRAVGSLVSGADPAMALGVSGYGSQISDISRTLHAMGGINLPFTGRGGQPSPPPQPPEGDGGGDGGGEGGSKSVSVEEAARGVGNTDEQKGVQQSGSGEATEGSVFGGESKEDVQRKMEAQGSWAGSAAEGPGSGYSPGAFEEDALGVEDAEQAEEDLPEAFRQSHQAGQSKAAAAEPEDAADDVEGASPSDNTAATGNGQGGGALEGAAFGAQQRTERGEANAAVAASPGNSGSRNAEQAETGSGSEGNRRGSTGAGSGVGSGSSSNGYTGAWAPIQQALSSVGATGGKGPSQTTSGGGTGSGGSGPATAKPPSSRAAAVAPQPPAPASGGNEARPKALDGGAVSTSGTHAPAPEQARVAQKAQEGVARPAPAGGVGQPPPLRRAGTVQRQEHEEGSDEPTPLDMMPSPDDESRY